MTEIRYTRPGRQRQYVSIKKHFSTAKNTHSKWKSVQIERDTFDAADYGNHNKNLGYPPWEDDSGNLWGFLDNFQIIGEDKEQFGFFPIPTNQSDPWHGYPIVPFKKRKISEKLLKLWIDGNYMDGDDVNNLISGKRL